MNYQFLKNFPKLATSCPPKHYTAENKEAYRWVHNDITNENNFKPRYYLMPPRQLNNIKEIKDKAERDHQLCLALGLSLFRTEEEAKKSFNYLKKIFKKKIFKIFGTHLAHACLIKEDGVNSTVDKKGHFTHHPVSVDHYPSKFVITSQL